MRLLDRTSYEWRDERLDLSYERVRADVKATADAVIAVCGAKRPATVPILIRLDGPTVEAEPAVPGLDIWALTGLHRPSDAPEPKWQPERTYYIWTVTTSPGFGRHRGTDYWLRWTHTSESADPAVVRRELIRDALDDSARYLSGD